MTTSENHFNVGVELTIKRTLWATIILTYQRSSGKSWLDKLKNSISGEPRSKEELVSVITDAEQNEIIDPQTREMIEGVIGVNEMRVRDIMIPRAQMTTIDVEQKVEEFLPVMLESAHPFPVITR